MALSPFSSSYLLPFHSFSSSFNSDELTSRSSKQYYVLPGQQLTFSEWDGHQGGYFLCHGRSRRFVQILSARASPSHLPHFALPLSPFLHRQIRRERLIVVVFIVHSVIVDVVVHDGFLFLQDALDPGDLRVLGLGEEKRGEERVFQLDLEDVTLSRRVDVFEEARSQNLALDDALRSKGEDDFVDYLATLQTE